MSGELYHFYLAGSWTKYLGTYMGVSKNRGNPKMAPIFGNTYMLFQPSNVFGKHSNRDFLGSFATCFADVFLEVIGAPSLIWCGRHVLGNDNKLLKRTDINIII